MSPVHGERRLADAGGARDRHQRDRRAVVELGSDPVQLVDLGLPTGEVDDVDRQLGGLVQPVRPVRGEHRRHRRVPALTGCRFGQVQIGLTGQDRAFEPAQISTRIETELAGQGRSGCPVDRECLDPPTRAIQREHELRLEPLPVGLLGDQRGQLRYQVHMPA